MRVSLKMLPMGGRDMRCNSQDKGAHSYHQCTYLEGDDVLDNIGCHARCSYVDVSLARALALLQATAHILSYIFT